MNNAIKIALLGQPNSGKSTLFNGLTGSHQHVGNWAGKTVEKMEGSFSHNSKVYEIVDLPGSYSLSAISQEEIITRDYIASENADIVFILVDSSQIERSMFMLADYSGIKVPAVLILNLMDVANFQGKTFDCKAISDKLNIPVVPFNATNKKDYEVLLSETENALSKRCIINESELCTNMQNEFTQVYTQLLSLVPQDTMGVYSSNWIISKLIDNDSMVLEYVKSKVELDTYDKILEIVSTVKDGTLHTGNCKFQWIDNILTGCVTIPKTESQLSKFDKIATSSVWGKPLAILSILAALLASMIIGAPVMSLGAVFTLVIGPLLDILNTIGIPSLIVSLFQDAVITSISFAMLMCGFVFGTTLVFGILEESGYMARISFAFDNMMQKLGLHGKAVMPFMMSFGCNIAGASGTRVLDSWSQKVKAIAVSWIIPCGSTWAIVGLFGTLFFGSGVVLIVLIMFALALLHMVVTAKLFDSTSSVKVENTGIIMELPPYHKIKLKHLLKTSAIKTWGTFKKAIVVITSASVIFWALSYTASGDIASSIIYKVGIFIEPVTMFFGLKWQTFMAWLTGAIAAKEAVLGVLAALFNSQGIFTGVATSGMAVDTNLISNGLLSAITKPEALAFIFAFFFNMPCMIAFTASTHELHSIKITLKIALYYVGVSLLFAFLAYHVGLLIF